LLFNELGFFEHLHFIQKIWRGHDNCCLVSKRFNI
jgi:hypothetical protein